MVRANLNHWATSSKSNPYASAMPVIATAETVAVHAIAAIAVATAAIALRTKCPMG